MLRKKLLLIFFSGNASQNMCQDKISSEGFLHTYMATKDIKADKFIFYNGRPAAADLWDSSYKCFQQQGDGEGEKLQNAFIKGFLKEYEQIVYIKGGVHEITEAIIQKAFSRLFSYDVVYGLKETKLALLGISKFNIQKVEIATWTKPKDLSRELIKAGYSNLHLPLLKPGEEFASIKELARKGTDIFRRN